MTKGCAHAASGSLASGPAHGSGLPEWCFFLFFDLRLCFSPVGACVLDASGAAAAGSSSEQMDAIGIGERTLNH